MTITKDSFIVGAGGGKGGKQRQPVEAPNTLQSRQTIRVQEVLSEGPVLGLVNGLKGIFLDDTAIQNSNGSFNFPAIGYDFRYGTPDQEYMPGFPGVESATVINVEIDDPIVRTVSSADVDAVRIGVRIPQLYAIDVASGDRNGYRVGIAIDIRPAGGAWVTALQKTITGKAIHPYEESFRVERPSTSGIFDVRVRRTTVKSQTDTKQDSVFWFTLTEIQDIKVSYPNAAVVGLAIDSEATGGRIPKRSYLMDGLIVKVPSTYEPTVYAADGSVVSYAHYTSPIWNGTFKNEWTDDPAWILYDLLTNPRYGLGAYIDEGSINIYDFFEASKYNCGLIPKGDGSANVEPRFTFNGPLQARENAYKVIQTLAASFRAVLFSAPGYIRLIQDRPQGASAKLNNSNVVNGEFSYTGTELQFRTTAVIVNYNDRDNQYNPRSVIEEASETAIARYGYNQVEISPVGVTGEGQARRLAKWMIDTATNSVDNVSFQVSWNNAFMEVGDVIEIADEDYAQTKFSGMLVAIPGGNANQIKFDQALTLNNGDVVKYINFLGEEQTRTISVPGVNTDTFTLVASTGALNPNDFPGVPYVVIDDIHPRLFKVMSVSESDIGVYDVVAGQYDPTKYARVEQGIYVDPPLFTNIGGWTIEQPENISVEVETYLNRSGVVRYKLHFNWDDVEDENLKYYRIQWRRDNGAFEWTDFINHSEFTLDDCLPGIYEYSVYAYNTRGIQSPAGTGWYELATTSVAPSPLVAVTDLRLVDGGTTFNSNQFTIRWNHSESVVNATRLDYQINIHNGTNLSAPIVHTLYQTDNLLTITRDNIVSWMGGPERNIFISVRPRDTMERLGQPAGALFNNPAPVIPSNIQAFAFFTSYQIDHSQVVDGDVAGYVVHHSTSSNFVPAPSNLVQTGVGTSHLVPAEAETTYYVRVAAYDTWSQQGLNYAPELSVTTTSMVVGITPTPPSGLAATSTIVDTSPGVQQARITLTWTKSTNTDVYDLAIRSTEVGMADFPVVSQPTTGNGTYSFYGVPGATYTFQIRSRAATNVSEWSSVVTHVAAAVTIPPAIPTAITLSSGFGSMAVSWTNPTATDLSKIEVYRRKTNAPTEAETLVASVPAPMSSYFDSGLTIGGQYMYRLRAVNRSGLTSGYSVGVSATVLGIPSGSVDLTAFATGLQPIEIVSSLPTTGNFVGRTVFLTTDNKLYRRTASAWTAAVPTSDLTGQITGVQITDNAVTAAKIAANTITASEINAASIRTAVLITNSITTGMIQAGAVTADEIAANSIVSAKIAANQVTATHIAANTITANEINANSIRAAVLTANSVTATQIAANTITSAEINAGSIRAAILVANSITATMIAANQITATHVGANTIVTNSANIADAVIISAKIQNGAIENAKIANGAVTNLKISGLLSSNNYVYNQTGWGFNKTDGSLSLNGNVPGQGRTTLTNTGLYGYDGSGNLRFALGL